MNAAAALLALALALPNADYVRSRSDTGIAGDPKAHCLWWPAGPVGYQQSDKGNPETRPVGSEFTAVRKSFESWQAVMDSCGSLTLAEGPRLASTLIGHSPGSSDNHNTVVFRQTYCANEAPASSDCWRDQTCMNVFDCWEWGINTIALTTTTYERSTGRIYDSDIELNAYSFIFTTVDSPPCAPPAIPYSQNCVATDVQNTMTHEAGHLLGMDHTGRPDSTMSPSAPGGETSKRVIDPGSRLFVCDVYPKGKASRDCVIDAVSASLGPEAGCGAAAGGTALGALGALLVLARRRRKSSR